MTSFDQVTLSSLWLSVRHEYPFLSEKETILLLPFVTYLHAQESIFSS